MTDNQIKAVLFDLGDTLLNFGQTDMVEIFRQGARSTHNYLKGMDLSVNGYLHYCWKNLVFLRLRYWLSNIRNKDFNSLDLLKKTNAGIGSTLTETQWEQLAWLWYEPLSRVCQNEPDIVETFGSLKEKNLKLGIISNTFVPGHVLERHLALLGILDFFSVRLYSCDFDFRKPDLRIFEVAAERIGEKPENTAYVGDRIDKDIEPTLKLNMHAILKTAPTNTGRKIPDHVWRIDRISELPALIEKINSPSKKNPSPGSPAESGQNTDPREIHSE